MKKLIPIIFLTLTVGCSSKPPTTSMPTEKSLGNIATNKVSAIQFTKKLAKSSSAIGDRGIGSLVDGLSSLSSNIKTHNKVIDSVGTLEIKKGYKIYKTSTWTINPLLKETILLEKKYSDFCKKKNGTYKKNICSSKGDSFIYFYAKLSDKQVRAGDRPSIIVLEPTLRKGQQFPDVEYLEALHRTGFRGEQGCRFYRDKMGLIGWFCDQ